MIPAGIRKKLWIVSRNVFRSGIPPSVTWINIDGLSNPGIIETIGKYFTIHPLILESILTPEQRPRMEDLEQYLYLNLKMLSWRPLPAGIKIENISLVIGPNYLLSFQEDIGDIFDPIRDRIRKDGRIRKFGPDYLAYGLIDVIVDNYFVVVEQLSEQVEDLEEELVAQATRETLNRSMSSKRI
jgi:magnesium transporter